MPSWDVAIPQAMQQHGGRNRHVAVPAQPAPNLAPVKAEEQTAGLVPVLNPSLEAAPAVEPVKA